MEHFDPRFFRHLDTTLPPLPDEEIFALMREMNTWSLWDKLGWLEAAHNYLEARGILPDDSRSDGAPNSKI